MRPRLGRLLVVKLISRRYANVVNGQHISIGDCVVVPIQFPEKHQTVLMNSIFAEIIHLLSFARNRPEQNVRGRYRVFFFILSSSSTCSWNWFFCRRNPHRKKTCSRFDQSPSLTTLCQAKSVLEIERDLPRSREKLTRNWDLTFWVAERGDDDDDDDNERASK